MGMVDISGKPDVLRIAVARGELQVLKATLGAIQEGRVEKGDVLESAKVAVLQAVKETPRILPYCHPIPISSVRVSHAIRDDVEWGRIQLTVEVKARYRTGVEMEALCGVMAGLLTIWDMVKSLEKDPRGLYPETRILNVGVVEKRKEEVEAAP